MEVNCYNSTRNLKIKVMVAIIIFIVSLVGVNYTFVSASQSELGDLNSYGGNAAGSQRVNSIAGVIVGIIRTIGIVLSVAMLIGIGIKYMMGSVEEKASYKESLKPYIIGAFLIFTGSLVPQLIYTISQNFN